MQLSNEQFATHMVLKYGSLKQAFRHNLALGNPSNAEEQDEMDGLNRLWDSYTAKQRSYVGTQN